MENIRASELASAREAKIYEALLGAKDKEVQALALAGLLESSQPKAKKSGFRGFLGEMETSPTFARLQEMISTPVTEQDPTRSTVSSRQLLTPMTPRGVPSGMGITEEAGPPPPPTGQTQPQITTPPGGAPAAQAAGDLVSPQGQAAQPPPQPLQYQSMSGQSVTRTRPRQIFATTEEKIREEMLAKGRAETAVEGERWTGLGFTPAEQKEMARAQEIRLAGGATGNQYAEGEIVPDPASPTGFSQIMWHKTNPNQQIRVPAMDPTVSRAPQSLGVWAERAAGQLGYPNAAAARAAGPGIFTAVNALAQKLQAEAAGAITTERGDAAAAVPLTISEKANLTLRMGDDWRLVSTKQRDQKASLAQIDAAYAAAQVGGAYIPPAAESIIVLFERVIDPNSVVREAEARRPGTMQPLITRMQAKIDQWKIGGGSVPIEELKAYVELARSMTVAADGVLDEERQKMNAIADDYGLDSILITGSRNAPTDPNAPVNAAPAPPAAGGAPPAVVPAANPGAAPVVPGMYQDERGVWRFGTRPQ